MSTKKNTFIIILLINLSINISYCLFVYAAYATESAAPKNTTLQELNTIVISYYKTRFPEVEAHFKTRLSQEKYKQLYKIADTTFRISLNKKLGNFVAYIIKGGFAEPYDTVYAKLFLTIIDSTNKKVIADFDLRHKYYGASTFTQQKLDVIKRNDEDYLIFYQVRYGGDGDHTENRLKIFFWNNRELKKLADENIHGVKITQQQDGIHITGNHIITLCDVCDGWEDSNPLDIFQIPIAITVLKDQIRRSCTLSQKEKEALLQRFNERKRVRLAKKAKYGSSKDYESFLNKITENFHSVIESK